MRDEQKENIEDMNDLEAAEAAYDEYTESGNKSRPVEKLWEDLDL